MNCHTDKQLDAEARYQAAYEDAKMRGLCEVGAREVAADAMISEGLSGMPHLHIKRIYDEPADEDGQRILVDRLWPRGVSNDDAHLTAWFKDLAPSDELRRWYDHDPKRFERFAASYRAELDDSRDAIERLRDSLDLRRRVTLLTATRDLEHSHATVLAGYLKDRL